MRASLAPFAILRNRRTGGAGMAAGCRAPDKAYAPIFTNSFCTLRRFFRITGEL